MMLNTPPSSIAATATLLVLSIIGSVWGDKDSSYYAANRGNPNGDISMYWKDSDNIFQDITSFKELYVEFDSCVWTWMKYSSSLVDGEESGSIEENDYWYMGSVPPMGANVAYSLYGTLNNGGSKSSSGSGNCNKDTFINSFHTNQGYTSFVQAMKRTSSSGFSNIYMKNLLNATCYDGYGVGCHSNYGFAEMNYDGSDCDPADYSGVADQMSNLNSALNGVTCVKIFDISKWQGYDYSVWGTPLELLARSTACNYLNYYSPDGVCPDPYGKLAYYVDNFEKGIKLYHDDPWSIYYEEVALYKDRLNRGFIMVVVALFILLLELFSVFTKIRMLISTVTNPSNINSCAENAGQNIYTTGSYIANHMDDVEKTVKDPTKCCVDNTTIVETDDDDDVVVDLGNAQQTHATQNDIPSIEEMRNMKNCIDHTSSYITRTDTNDNEHEPISSYMTLDDEPTVSNVTDPKNIAMAPSFSGSYVAPPLDTVQNNADRPNTNDNSICGDQSTSTTTLETSNFPTSVDYNNCNTVTIETVNGEEEPISNYIPFDESNAVNTTEQITPLAAPYIQLTHGENETANKTETVLDADANVNSMTLDQPSVSDGNQQDIPMTHPTDDVEIQTEHNVENNKEDNSNTMGGMETDVETAKNDTTTEQIDTMEPTVNFTVEGEPITSYMSLGQPNVSNGIELGESEVRSTDHVENTTEHNIETKVDTQRQQDETSVSSGVSNCSGPVDQATLDHVSSFIDMVEKNNGMATANQVTGADESGPHTMDESGPNMTDDNVPNITHGTDISSSSTTTEQINNMPSSIDGTHNSILKSDTTSSIEKADSNDGIERADATEGYITLENPTVSDLSRD